MRAFGHFASSYTTKQNVSPPVTINLLNPRGGVGPCELLPSLWWDANEPDLVTGLVQINTDAEFKSSRALSCSEDLPLSALSSQFHDVLRL